MIGHIGYPLYPSSTAPKIGTIGYRNVLGVAAAGGGPVDPAPGVLGSDINRTFPIANFLRAFPTNVFRKFPTT